MLAVDGTIVAPLVTVDRRHPNQNLVVASLLLAWCLFLPKIVLPQAIKPLSTTAIAERATPATVTIIALAESGDTLGQGSGFLVRASGVVVTNWHVVAGAQRAIVVLSSGEEYSKVLYLDGDSTRDVVLLQIPAAGLATLPIRNDVPPPGSRVVVIGSPLGLSRTISDGILSAKRLVDGNELVQLSAPISHGSSGGPVLDDRGRVFAIASSFLAEGQQLNFAVPVRYAVGLLALQPSPEALSSSPVGLARNREEGQLTASSATSFWSPARATSPRPTLGGYYMAYQWTQHTTSEGKKEPAWTTLNVLVVNDSGSGWRGFSCDTLGACESAHWSSIQTAPSGDVVLDLGYVALDGYQADDGFLVHGGYPSNGLGGTLDLWMRGWLFTPPLSRRGGLYRCSARTQFVDNDGYRGEYVDWAGQGAVLETRDSTYVEIYLANSSGGTVAPVFRERRTAAGEFESSHSIEKTTIHVKGGWSPGAFYGDWSDTRRNGVRFEGPLTCNRI